MKTFLRGLLPMLAAALLVLAAAGSARAQSTYAPQLPGPGPISNTSGILSGGNITANSAAFEVPVIAAPAGSGTGGGDALAFTGADSNLIAAGGMGLLLVGGAAVIYSRRRD